MSKRAYAVIAIVAVLIAVGFAVAEWQRARKTAELMDDLDTGNPDVAVDTLHELKKRGDSIEGELIARLRTHRRKERMRAAYLLGEIGNAERSGPVLARLLDDEWAPVRRAAASALGRLGYGPAFPQLLAMVQDEEQDMESRCIALQSIGLLALNRGIDPVDRGICVVSLVKILERRPDVPPPVDEEAAEEEEAEGEEEEEALPEEPEPADTEIELRKECVLALGLLDTPEALAALLESIDDTVEPAAIVRQCACMAIADLPDVPTDDKEAALMGNDLLDALEDSAPSVRIHAVMALARHTDFRTESVDRRIDDALREMSQELVEEADASYWVREAARVACSRRHVSLQETAETDEGSS
jgi:HEAT repeat protein